MRTRSRLTVSHPLQDVNEGCVATCPTSCSSALESYLEEYTQLTGYRLNSDTRAKLLRLCTKRCNQQCVKGGSAYDFVTTYRKY